MQERAKELAVIESMDSGKPIREARDIDIPLACNHFFYYAGWADKLDYAFPNRKISPLGVAGQIIPWNFPLLMAAWKIAPALAAGNTVVLKPAETTSLTALKLAEIIEESGLPAGVVNIITGHGDTGASIVNHPDINKIAFTGSTGVGKIIQKAISGTEKKATLELGGKSANIIFDDAPLDQAIEGIVNGIFFNQGHVCCAGSRLFVQENIAEKVIRKLKHRMKSLVVGNPLDKNTDVGAINSKEQLQIINKYIKLGKEEGAEIYQSACPIPKKGFFCPPTIFTNVAQSSIIVQEEIFGPVLTIQTFRTVDEVIQKANNTPYGLAAGVWTDKGARIFNLTTKLKAGVVWANTYNKFDPASPFGGYKESGFGREGGMHGLSAYLKLS
jgi:aldehyde dehydrogenase (NAD+)